MYLCISNSYRISNPFSPRSGEISFVSNPLRFDHFARAAGKFFQYIDAFFHLQNLTKAPKKSVCRENQLSAAGHSLCRENQISAARNSLCR